MQPFVLLASLGRLQVSKIGSKKGEGGLCVRIALYLAAFATQDARLIKGDLGHSCLCVECSVDSSIAQPGDQISVCLGIK